MNLKFKDIEQNAEREVCDQERKSLDIGDHCAFNSNFDPSLFEIFKAKSGELNRNARVSAGRFAWSDIFCAINSKSPQFRRMNRSSVVSPRGLRRPSVNSLPSNFDIHCVLRMDFINQMPADGDFLMWVCDGDSFIKKSNLRSNENQVRNLSNKKRPANSGYSVMDAAFKNTYGRHPETERVDAASHEKVIPGAINIGVTHRAMFSRKAA